MRVTTFAGRLPHFADWIIPIWQALPPEYRDTFHALGRSETRAASYKLQGIVGKAPRGKPLVMVASYEDYRAVGPSPCILVNHGIGQTYEASPESAGNPCYSGGDNRERVLLFLGPSERDAEVSRKAYPGARSVAVGVPKLDRFFGVTHVRNDPPLVALTNHADIHVCSETRWTLPFYRNELIRLAKLQPSLPFRLIGHCHPRMHTYMMKFWNLLKIPFEPDPNVILNTADCLVFDNTSFGYEFASTNRPVVVLDAPHYRREVNHGLRFWDAADVGVRISHPSDLESAISLALSDPISLQTSRQSALDLVYDGIAFDGRATERAVSAIIDLCESLR